MIDELHVKDVALIKDLTIHPSNGLTAITGETGSGKTALLSAISLLIGEHSSKDMIRDGSNSLNIEARVFTDDCLEDGHVISRSFDERGRGRVNIDGSIASVYDLQTKIGNTIDLCGQHEHQMLMNISSHKNLLDAWIGKGAFDALDSYAKAFDKVAEAKTELHELEEFVSTGKDKLDIAEFDLKRIEEVSPEEGELERLSEKLERAEHAERLLSASAIAHDTLSDDGGIIDTLSSITQEVYSASSSDESLSEIAETMESLGIELDDVASRLRKYSDSLDVDEQMLQEMQARQASLQGLIRNYGPSMDDVFERWEEAQKLVSAGSNSEAMLKAAHEKLDEAEAELKVAAKNLDSVRVKHSPNFSKAVTDQMQKLNMGSAELICDVSMLPKGEWTKSGPDHVEFMYKSGSGVTKRPLKKIASGGEISRVMLALKVVLEAVDSVDTLVFDEVDAGVGGATALALADVLSSLAKTHQVICVTHLPQVAAHGDSHLVVSKLDNKDGIPETSIQEVEGDERISEIARMLSGDTSKTSLAHARELLEQNGKL